MTRENKPTTKEEQDGGIDRRSFMQSVFAAGAAGATGTALSSGAAGEVAVPDTPVSFSNVTFEPTSPSSIFEVVYGRPTGTGLLVNALKDFGDSGTNVGDIAFHNTALSMFSSWRNTHTIIQNYLGQLTTTMNVRARSAVADAYQAGKTQSEAQQAVADAVYARADTAARNAVVSKMTLAIQLANISATAQNTSEVLDDWETTFFFPSGYSGSGSVVAENTGIIETEVTETTTLPSGDTTEIESVEFAVEWDNGDSATYTVSDLLVNYDESSGEFSLSTENGNTLTDDFTGSVPSVPSADLASQRCINLSSLGDIYTEIDQKAQTVVGNYGATFVGDIYSALDNGTITPGQLRGVEGLASLLSGSTEATESRYQLALSTLYDIPRPDLSKASYMEVELDGWTGESIRVDTSGNRSRILENRTKAPIPYRGQMFAENVSTDLKAGESYLFDVPIASGGSNSLALLDSSDGSAIWENSSVGTVNGVAPLGKDTLITGLADNSVALLNSSDGSVIWQNSSVHSGAVRSVGPLGADGVITGSFDGSVAVLNSSDGSVIWQNSSVHSNDVRTVAPLGTDSVITGSNDVSAALLDGSDGSVIWQNSSVHSDDVRAVAPLGTDSVITGSFDESVALLDGSDGSKIWQNSSVHSEFLWAVGQLGTDSVITGSSGGLVALLDSSDGSVIWENSSVHSSAVISVAPLGTDSVITGSYNGSVALLDGSDGSVIWENSSVRSTSVTSLFAPTNHNPDNHDGKTYGETYDGRVSNGFFGGVNLANDSDEFEEVPIRGSMKIISMQDSDGNSVDQIKTDPDDPDTEYGAPDFEELDNEEFAQRLDEIEAELADALDEAGDEQSLGLPDIDGPGNILGDLPSLPGFSTLESLVIVGVGGWLAGQLSN